MALKKKRGKKSSVRRIVEQARKLRGSPTLTTKSTLLELKRWIRWVDPNQQLQLRSEFDGMSRQEAWDAIKNMSSEEGL